MSVKWTALQKKIYRRQLLKLYIRKNLTIKQIAKILNLSQSGIYCRLLRLKIPILRHKKLGYNNVNVRISLPGKKTSQLAEFLGIMLGDGHVTKTQVAVTLGNKDEYAEYVADKMKGLFNAVPKIIITEHKYKIVYFGSTRAAKWLLRNGLAYNKKKAGVRLPCWIFKNKLFMTKALKGLIDTDGSIYKTRFGLQISFSNASLPLLADVRKVYKKLGFSPSKVSVHSVYLTRKSDVIRYCGEIGFGNSKHIKRFHSFMGGSYSGNYT